MKTDQVIDTATFKKLSPAQRARPTKKNGVQLVGFHTLVKDGNRLVPKPEAMVFVEGATVLKNNKGPVQSWNAQGVPVAKI